MIRAGIFGAIALALAMCSTTPAFAQADTCSTPEAIAAVVKDHPEVAGQYVLTAHEAFLGIDALEPEGTEESTVVAGIAVVRSDGAVFFRIWYAGGQCRTFVIHPESGFKFLSAVKGRGV